MCLRVKAETVVFKTQNSGHFQLLPETNFLTSCLWDYAFSSVVWQDRGAKMAWPRNQVLRFDSLWSHLSKSPRTSASAGQALSLELFDFIPKSLLNSAEYCLYTNNHDELSKMHSARFLSFPRIPNESTFWNSISVNVLISPFGVIKN